MQASNTGGYTGCVIAVFVHGSVLRRSKVLAGEVVAAFRTCGDEHVLEWAWRLRPPSLDDSRCDVFHETNTRIAGSSPYRALSYSSYYHHHSRSASASSIPMPELPDISNVVFPLSRAAMQMQVMLGSAPWNIDDYSTLALFAAALQMQFGVDRQDLYFGPMDLSYQRRDSRAYLQGSRRPTSIPHPYRSADVILRHSRIKSLRNGSQTGASVTDTTPLSQRWLTCLVT
ncbi:uncharacterized protein M421DRAFT_388891 [Didymella exigua CBS 183.55]|uniref:Uncharacterized protein n=1 Tax=Didymella exigua CBS 183.55 TaxID=1150837 RepID=A0A6A5S2L6_9PLEO|nr:uncharacterized protein M421DRAFT_388891 [Didymella exigua CBS 183.55]KAF1934352.1 hypothetical protein M421DRAFT_388891 [Didymella exigua CBS 183.55]